MVRRPLVVAKRHERVQLDNDRGSLRFVVVIALAWLESCYSNLLYDTQG